MVINNLRKSAVSGVKWALVSQVSGIGLQLITTTIFARLLLPSDYGLMGMAMVWIGFVNIFKDLGTSAAIIQHKDITDTVLSSIFWINLFFGLLVMIILFLFSSPIAYFYHEPRVVGILRFLSLTFFIVGFSIMQHAILQRNMAFNKIAKIELASAILSTLIGITLAFQGKGVWSLVFKAFSEVALTTIFLWSFGGWRPKMVFVWSEVKSVFNFSLNLTGFNIFNYFSRNVDNLLIGKYLGAQDLGYYIMVYRLMFAPLQNVNNVLGKVFFPVYSKMQDDNARLKRFHLKVIGTIAFITFPMMLGLFSLSKIFVLTVLGEKWRPIILMVSIYSIVGLLQTITATGGSIYQSKGRVDWLLRWGVCSGLFIVSSFVIGLHWGIMGVIIAYTIANIILAYPNLAIPFKLINLSFSELLTVLLRPLLCSLFMTTVIISLKTFFLYSFPNGVMLVVLIVAGSITYIGVSFFFNSDKIRDILELANIRSWCIFPKKSNII